MITVKYYNDSNTARIFRDKDYIADLRRDGYEDLTLSDVTDILDDFGVKRIVWNETENGWKCEILNFGK